MNHEAERGWWDVRLFAGLLLAAVIGSAAVFPYALALTGVDLASLPLPYGLALAASTAQTSVLAAVAIVAGMWFGPKVGLNAPLLSTLLHGGSASGGRARRLLVLAIPTGLLATAVILLLDSVLFSSAFADLAQSGAAPPVWSGLLASLYGGIVEELLLRFGLMTFLAWLLMRLSRSDALQAWQFWGANVTAAVLFGLGHLPATAAIAPLTGTVVVRAIVLNGIPGVAFGWLYGRNGLLTAMAAHMTADITLHGLIPLLSA
jgi:membrane protease YdiL (CAAX protease family)